MTSNRKPHPAMQHPGATIVGLHGHEVRRTREEDLTDILVPQLETESC